MTGEAGKLPVTDLHSHLVPGVDDGARTLDDVLEGLGRMVARGVRRVVTTPHLRGSLLRDPPALEARLEEVEGAFRTAAREAARRHPEIEFGHGFEIMLDRRELDLSDSRLSLGSTKAVLVEWPLLRIPPETPQVVRELREQGVEVLLAHPERYHGHDDELRLVERWRAEGALLQVNHGSLCGRYGPEVRRRAFRMLERSLVDCLATDFHGRPELRLFLKGAGHLLRELGAEEQWDLLTRTNPDRILRGVPPLPVPEVSRPRSVLDRLLSLFRG